jgi:hypothetical protein
MLSRFPFRLLGVAIGCLWLSSTLAQGTAATSIAGARFAADASTSARFSLGLTRDGGRTFDTSAATTDNLRVIGTIEP